MINKKEEFEKLYLDWIYSFGVSAFGCSNPAAYEPYCKLKEWCKNNKQESLEYIKEILEDEPSDIVMILQDLYVEEFGIQIEGYMQLEPICNLWLNVLNKDKGLNNGKIKDYYKDYHKWKKHLDKNYLPWRPNLENDPNVTQEEFKQGKRNNKNFKHKWHKFPLSILKDEELIKLKEEGHIGEMTKYIEELSFFYNRLDEEIKRRNFKK